MRLKHQSIGGSSGVSGRGIGPQIPLYTGVSFNPYLLPNNAGIYSLNGSASDSTYLLNSGNVQLIADRSGNSAVNGLVLNGASGNNAAVSALGAFGTGDFSVSVKLTATSIASQTRALGSQTNGFALVIDTNGALITSLQAVGNNTASSAGQIVVFTEAVIGYTRSGTTGTYYKDGVAVGTITDNRNYTVGLTEIGSTAGALTPIFGMIKWTHAYSVALTGPQMLADAGGTIQANSTLNVDFTLQAKLAPSFTATTGGTVTINTSGDLGARISGARDLVQMTAAKMPAFSVVSGYNTATFDGSNDYMKAAAFSLSQPESVYYVGSQVTWTSADYFCDGGTTTTARVYQWNSTNAIINDAGGVGALAWSLNSKAVIRAIFNGVSSQIALNLGAATSTSNATTANGFTLGSEGNGLANFGNITFNEALLRAAADANALQLQIAGAEIKRWGIVA